MSLTVRKEEPEKRVAKMGSEKQSGRGSDAAGLPESPHRTQSEPSTASLLPSVSLLPSCGHCSERSFSELGILGKLPESA